MADFFQTVGGPGPWGLFDKDAKLHFELNFAPWVTSAGTGLTLTSATVLASPLLTIDRQSITPEGLVRFRVQLVDPEGPIPRAFVPFTIRLVLSDDQQDDRTFYLRVTDR